VFGLLEGKNVNLRLMEKEDIPLYSEWCNNPEFFGEFDWFPQRSRAEREKRYDALTSDTKCFFIEKKDGAKIGWVVHYNYVRKHQTLKMTPAQASGLNVKNDWYTLVKDATKNEAKKEEKQVRQIQVTVK
jgi:RimJ/RimL family protein N-acetyltransferase